MCIIAVDNVTKMFGGLAALDGVTLHVSSNELLSVIGPNGSGKSTLFNVITNVYAPSQGQVLFKGKVLTGVPAYRVPFMGIGRTFQNIRLFGSLTALENVIAGLHPYLRCGVVEAVMRPRSLRNREIEARDKAKQLLELVGVGHRGNEPVGSLPYGYQKRIEIARALANSPSVLLLDEPVAGLNSSERAEMIQLISRLRAQGVTIVLIEHNMDVVMRISDRIVVLSYGKKIAEGIPSQIRNDPAVIEAYLGKGKTWAG